MRTYHILTIFVTIKRKKHVNQGYISGCYILTVCTKPKGTYRITKVITQGFITYEGA